MTIRQSEGCRSGQYVLSQQREPPDGPPAHIRTTLANHRPEKDRQIAQLQAHVAQLEARIAQFEQLLEKATGVNKRQSAPFSKEAPKDNTKTPGRKGGFSSVFLGGF